MHAHDVNRHDASIRATCITLDRPVDAQALDRCIESMLMLWGPEMLRVKGIVNIAGLDRPMAIHGVQHSYHPPILLDAWPDADRRSRIVFITSNLNPKHLRAGFELFGMRPAIAA